MICQRFLATSVRLKQYSWGIPWAFLTHHNNSKVALSVIDLKLLHVINHFNKVSISGVKILTSLFGHDCQLSIFKVTLNKHNKITRIVWHLVQRYITIPLFHSTDTCGSRTTGPFHNNVPKNDSPPCTMMNLLSLWDEITCCVSSWGRVIRSDYQAMHRIFDYLQGMLITLLLDFSVTPAINPHHSLVDETAVLFWT